VDISPSREKTVVKRSHSLEKYDQYDEKRYARSVKFTMERESSGQLSFLGMPRNRAPQIENHA